MVLPPSAKSQGSNRSDTIGDHILHGYIIRHSAISLSLNSGADPFAVQKLAGHSDVRLTTQTYAHVQAEALGRAVGVLERVGLEGGEVSNPAGIRTVPA